MRFDHTRKQRTGIVEAVLAENKRAEELLTAVEHGLRKNPFVLVTRCDSRQLKLLQEKYGRIHIRGQTVVIGQFSPPSGSPSVGIIAAGTSDLPVVEEIELTLQTHGIVSKRFKTYIFIK